MRTLIGEKHYYNENCRKCEYYSEEGISCCNEDDPEDEFLIYCKAPYCSFGADENRNPNILGNPWFAQSHPTQSE